MQTATRTDRTARPALYNYATGEYLRRATASERDASRAAACFDGGVGAFTATVRSKPVTCYVQE